MYPSPLPTLFHRTAIQILAFIKSPAPTQPASSVTLVSQDFTQDFLIDLRNVTKKPQRIIHTLVARTAIQDLEDSPGNDQKIREIGLKYSIVSSQTSFVAIEARQDGLLKLKDNTTNELESVASALQQKASWLGGLTLGSSEIDEQMRKLTSIFRE